MVMKVFITAVWSMPFKRDSLTSLQNLGHGEATGRGKDKLTGVFCDLLPFLIIAVILVFQVFLLDTGKCHTAHSTLMADTQNFVYASRVVCQPVSEATGNCQLHPDPEGLSRHSLAGRCSWASAFGPAPRSQVGLPSAQWLPASSARAGKASRYLALPQRTPTSSWWPWRLTSEMTLPHEFPELRGEEPHSWVSAWGQPRAPTGVMLPPFVCNSSC